MRRNIYGILLCVFMIFMQVVPAFALSSKGLPKASVTIDGRKLDVSAYVINNRTMVPMRAIFEALDSTLEWDASTQTVTAVKGTKVIKLTIGKTNATVDDQNIALAAPPVLVDSRTYVPLRFVAESLNCQVNWDSKTRTAMVNTNSGTPAGKQEIHEGTINPQGETWSAGSMHIVRGDFLVEGANSPVLTVEAGAVVRFEKDAGIIVGSGAPGGLVVEGEASKPAVFTAFIAGAQPGYWGGIKFYSQTMRGRAVIDNARIEYAGGPSSTPAGILVYSDGPLVEVMLKNVEIKNSQYAGIYLHENARLAPGSTNVKISGTVGSGSEGGSPIITDTVGADSLPTGEYKDNAVNAVLLAGNDLAMGQSAKWTNIGIPYQVTDDLIIEGSTSPTLTIEPGVEIRLEGNCAIYVGDSAPGSLVAVGWAGSPIKFNSMVPRAGGWRGIVFGESAGACRLEYAIIECAEIAADIYNDMGGFIKNSTIRSSSEYAIYRRYGVDGTSFALGLGNQFEGNAVDENME